MLVVWSLSGPVLGLGVGPDCLTQSVSSVVCCSQLQLPSSKSHKSAREHFGMDGKNVYVSILRVKECELKKDPFLLLRLEVCVDL